jgi:hypothetical protein
MSREILWLSYVQRPRCQLARTKRNKMSGLSAGGLGHGQIPWLAKRDRKFEISFPPAESQTKSMRERVTREVRLPDAVTTGKVSLAGPARRVRCRH